MQEHFYSTDFFFSLGENFRGNAQDMLIEGKQSPICWSRKITPN